jgi:hypothetical protein
MRRAATVMTRATPAAATIAIPETAPRVAELHRLPVQLQVVLDALPRPATEPPSEVQVLVVATNKHDRVVVVADMPRALPEVVILEQPMVVLHTGVSLLGLLQFCESDDAAPDTDTQL